MPKLRNGHAPDHVRDTAQGAFEAWMAWDGIGPEPTVEYEVGYVPRRTSLSLAMGLVWNCTDIVPGSVFDTLHDTAQCRLHTFEPVIKRRTYAVCARVILEDLKNRKAAA